MALTSTEQNKIMQLLGYGGKTLQPGSVIYNKIVNDRLTTLPADTELVTRTYLAQVIAIESQMNMAIGRLSAEKVADITLNRNELSDLRAERRKISREMAVHLDIPYLGASANIGICV